MERGPTKSPYSVLRSKFGRVTERLSLLIRDTASPEVSSSVTESTQRNDAAASPRRNRIDVHHHAIPDFYKDWLVERGLTSGGLQIPTWSVSQALDVMEEHDVATSILSISMPGVHLGNDSEARRMARRVNEEVADVVRANPARFGLFATLTLPDVEGAIAEADYAFDALGADGIILLANSRGLYLGNARLEPLMELLDARGAVVFVHPSSLPADPVDGVPPYICDFLLDTTRAAVNLVKNGVTQRYPDIRFILAHAGGFMPYAAHRIAFTFGLDGSSWDPEDVMQELRRFYFDTAQASTGVNLPSLLSFTSADKVLFGSDFPHVSRPGVEYFTRAFNSASLSEVDREAIDQGTAKTLFPRLA